MIRKSSSIGGRTVDSIEIRVKHGTDPVGNRHRALIDSELESQNLVVAPAARTILSLT
jgi:hypothetical protein